MLSISQISVSQKMAAAGNKPSGFDYMRIALATAVIALHSVEVTAGMKATLAIWRGWERPLVAIVLPMFFALSGFLVAGSLERNKSLVSFLGLRAIRLVPALLVEITLSALILGPILTTDTAADYFLNHQFRHYFLNVIGDIHYLLPGVFTHNPYPLIVNSQLWTIPYELKCYITLAVIAGIGLFSRRALLLLAMIGSQILVVLFIILDPPSHYGPTMPGTLLICDFLVGLTMFRFRDRIPWAHGLGLASAIVTVILFLIPYGDFLVAVPVAYLTVYLGVCAPRRNTIVLSGDYSYGLYLYGYPLQQAFTALGAWTYFWWLNLLVVYPLALGFAAFSWWCIERPALRLRHPLMRLERGALRLPAFRLYSRKVFGADVS